MDQATRVARFENRFLSKIDEHESGCWLWLGARNQCDYGIVFVYERGMRLAHRVAYELFEGPIPEGLTIDHLCRVRHCVNPDHMEPVPHAVNVGRGRSFMREKTHCPRGHAYDEANTYINASNKRHCRTCQRMHTRDYQIRKRGERERSVR